MRHPVVSDYSGITYESLKRLLMSYENSMDIVVHTGDCYYLEFKMIQDTGPRFFAAVQKKEEGAILRLHLLLYNTGITQMLSRKLLQSWDGNFSFVFEDMPGELLPELRQLLELSLKLGYEQRSPDNA